MIIFVECFLLCFSSLIGQSPFWIFFSWRIKSPLLFWVDFRWLHIQVEVILFFLRLCRKPEFSPPKTTFKGLDLRLWEDRKGVGHMGSLEGGRGILRGLVIWSTAGTAKLCRKVRAQRNLPKGVNRQSNLEGPECQCCCVLESSYFWYITTVWLVRGERLRQ